MSLFSMIVGLAHYNQTVISPRAYKFWINHNGNPKNLTYEEWIDLVEVSKKSD